VQHDAGSVSARGAGRRLKILLVEDEALILMAAVDTLEELGHDVQTASNAGAALEVLRGDASVDVMIADVNLPDMDGKALAAQARLARPRLPIVFATGYGMTVPADLAASGATAVIGKPYWAKDLEKAIHEVC
jgi:CheY-like chemotaxis protein